MDLPGVLKKQQVEFPGVNLRNVEFSEVIEKKSCGSQGLLVLGLRDEVLFCLEFTGVK